LLSYGFFSKEEIIRIVFSDSSPAKESQKWIWEVVQKALLVEGNLQMEEILENTFFEKMKAGAISSKDVFVQKFVATFLDVQNIKRYFRKRNFSAQESSFLPIAGGNISLSAFSRKEEKDFFEHLPRPFFQSVQDGMEFFHLTGRSSLLEDLLDRDFLQLILSFSRSEVNGVAPLFSFFWRKERNARVIRSVLVAKKNGMDEEEIRKAFSAFVF
jgi:vacuolar-type H+-ATPase subunit C/Vma6